MAPLAHHRTLAVTIAPARIRVLTDAISETVGIYPVDPALEDCRHREPPERELQDQRIRPAQLVLLGRDVRTLPATGERASGILGSIETRFGVAIQAVAGIDRGLPTHGIQVGNLDLMASRLQTVDGEFLQRAIQRARFGMGINKQNIHGKPP